MIRTLLDKIWGEKFDIYRDEVLNRNFVNLRYFSAFGTLIILSINLIGFSFRRMRTFNSELLLLLLYFTVMMLYSFLMIKTVNRMITLIFYIVLTPIMIVAILLGTFIDPEEPSIIIMTLMCALPVFILDKPWRIILYITSVAGIYCVCCYYAKERDLFLDDMADLFIFYILAVGVNIFTLCDRIDCVENFIKYREKSERDLLTGVYNRGTGVEKMELLIHNKSYGAFIMIDVDDFKQVNDNYGHINGDKVLKKISGIISENFSADDIVFRMGGDEFAVYAAGLTDEMECRRKFDSLYAQLSELKVEFSDEYKYSISLGCSFYSEKTGNFKQLYRNSDESLYEAKKSGKGCYRFSM